LAGWATSDVDAAAANTLPVVVRAAYVVATVAVPFTVALPPTAVVADPAVPGAAPTVEDQRPGTDTKPSI
jgi:hypothetical protein